MLAGSQSLCAAIMDASLFSDETSEMYSCTMSSGSEDGFHKIELTIFWDTDEELKEIIDYFTDTLRENDTFETGGRNGYHWGNFNFNYK